MFVMITLWFGMDVCLFGLRGGRIFSAHRELLHVLFYMKQYIRVISNVTGKARRVGEDSRNF